MQWFREAKWGNDRARRAMQRYSNMFSGKQINISMWRHMAIAISNRYLNKAFGEIDAGGGGDDDDDGGEDSLVDSIHDLQAGHGSHIAGLIYARLFGQGDLSRMNRRDGFRKVSMQWHRFFGFGAEDRVEQLGTKRPRYPFDEEREMTRRNRFGRLHRVDMQGQLKQMMGATAAFRGQQESVIRAVARGEWPIVQITPTGGGKSLTFMLPAYCTPDGVTVVVTPLVALQDDMAVRCSKLGIDAYVWRSRGVIQRAASLVFVTPESAVSKGFRTFVERMHGQQKLDRVVVDECHTVLQCSKGFRPMMMRIGETLQDFGVPVICLTATLKPKDEMALFRVMRFVPERVRMFREATGRKNIAYRVEVIDDTREDIAAYRSGRIQRRQANSGRKRIRANLDGVIKRSRANLDGVIKRSRANSNGVIKRSRANSNGIVMISRESEAEFSVQEEEQEQEEESEEDDQVMIERICKLVKEWTAEHTEGKVIVYGGTIKRVQMIADALGCVGYWRGAGDPAEKARRVAEWMSSRGGESGWMAATNAGWRIYLHLSTGTSCR
ncbi:hypothetical protein FPOA_13049 [Fusarium poae]|uniref:Helicase ATP-binding domain-containing protein n=1 Tax=Fusarium poae TaxID=36050 RepID=A0A1B8A719_FUSPO|nr:hypothetical protein FPOA_13049 [Fusarium poae]